MKSIAIFGAGIAGLSAAHELAEKGYRVHVFEYMSEPGGVARSWRGGDRESPSEFSWRGYGPWYHNTFDLMQRIPIGNGKTVYDNLTRPIKFIFTGKADKFMDSLSLSDQAVFGLEIARSATSGPLRISEYAHLNAANYMKPRMSEEGWKQYINMFGPWVGIDPQRASMHHVMSFMVKNIIPGPPGPYSFFDSEGQWIIGACDKWAVLNAPTNEAWFDPWVAYLKTLQVKFSFDTALKSIKINPDTKQIELVEIEHQAELYTVRASEYVIAISPFGMRDVLKESLRLYPESAPVLNSEYERYKKLTQDGPHNQVSFRIGFDRACSWDLERAAVIVSTSEFNITMYRQEQMWAKNVSLGQDIKSLWSGTACISYSPGSLYGKPLVDLTRKEFKEEILYQLGKDEGLNEMLKKECGSSFIELLPHIIHWDSWKNWKFVGDE